MRISIIDTSSLGDRSYLIDDGGVAVVVDPQRDIDRVLALAAERDARSPTCSRPTSTTTTSRVASNCRASLTRNTWCLPATTSPTIGSPPATATSSRLADAL